MHARRAQLLPERHRPRVFGSRNPRSAPTVLVDGLVAGTWRYTGDRVEVTPFESWPARIRREVGAEAERLAGFHR